ncbi:MAG: diguanylate cyclase [Devosia sp.]|nr:diguanylate cyclase [Devosia sp.]
MAQENQTRFSTRFLVPTIAAVGITTVALAGFVGWSANRIDAESLTREQHLVTRALAEQVDQLQIAQTDHAVWDNAIDAYLRGDRRWLVENLGLSAYDYYGHSRTILLDPQLKPLIALREGGQVPAKSTIGEIDALIPLIQRLRSLDGRAAIAAYNDGTRDKPPFETDVMLFEGEPALVGVMPLLSYSGANALPPGREPIYVSVAMLNDGMARYLEDQYLVAEPAFIPQPDPASGRAAHRMADKDGKPVTWFTWQPAQPGARLLAETLPALLVGLLIAAGIMALLLRNLRQALVQLQAEREDAQHRALHDPLTGLGNRRLFQTRLAQDMAAMPRGATRLALFALDLDHFKQVNDTLGHDAGDELLVQVASRIKATLPGNCTLARLGGDEFSIIMPGIECHEDAAALATSIIEALSVPFSLGGRTATIGTSIGIATAPDMGTHETDLTRHADDALYRAKNGGRNRYCLYSEAGGNEPKRREARLRTALAGSAG